MKTTNLIRKAVSVFVATFIALIMVAAPSFAGIGASDGGGTGGGSGSGNTGGGGAAPPPPVSSGGGGGTTVPSNVRADRRVPDAANNCPLRDDGRAALGADYLFLTEYTISYSGRSEYEGINGWIFDFAANNGSYFFHRETFLQRNCLYPSRTTNVVYQCVIKSDAEIWREVPNPVSLGTGTGYSGWAAGSDDIEGCKNSHSRVSIYSEITEDGYYVGKAVTTSQNITVQVPITANEATGTFDAPNVVGHSGIYAGVPKYSTASLDCVNGPQSPGIRLADYSGTQCSSQNSTTPVYQCLADPVKAQYEDQVGTFAGNRFAGMKDGRYQRLEFNQRVAGNGISVNKLTTRFERSASSTPWDTNLPNVSANQNLFNLFKNENDRVSAFTNSGGTETAWSSAPWNTVWTSAHEASDQGAETEITQRIRWEGTRTTTSFAITSIDPMSGTLGFTPITVQVPTTGDCTDSATLSYNRPIADSIR